jgi:hypothetical protein
MLEDAFHAFLPVATIARAARRAGVKDVSTALRTAKRLQQRTSIMMNPFIGGTPDN